MDKLPSFGTAIQNIIVPTFKTYTPLLQANSETIHSTPHKEYSYGPHDRHKLDVYTPTTPNPNGAVLIFVHGGGLVNGAKTLPVVPDDLVYGNLGHFFADKCGYTVIIPNYRLIMHGAKFPSGGEDLSLVVDWARTHPQELGSGDGPRDLYIMGNSAGGIHLTTYLLYPGFAELRKKILGHDVEQTLRLKAAVLLAVPFHFESAPESRSGSLNEYYKDRISQDSPYGLLKAIKEHGAKPADVVPGVRFLSVTSTLDPEDEVLQPGRDFVALWRRGDVSAQEGILVEVVQGHNHISPIVALGTGIDDEEAWGYRVAEMLKSISA